MFKSLRHLILPVVVSGLAACSTAPQVSVNTDYDHAANFGKYRTYAIDSSSIGLSATGAAALQQALRSDLAARGLKEVSGRGADLYIVPTVYTREKLNVMPVGGYTLTPSRFGSYGPGSVQLNATAQQYTEGSLVIDFVDSKTKTIVFRGLGQAAVGSTERNANAITEAVNKILAQYPSSGGQ
jgi:stage V sporulation protein SpoVS